MTSQFDIKISGTSSPDWDEWYIETHGGTKATWEDDEDVDDLDLPESMDDKDDR